MTITLVMDQVYLCLDQAMHKILTSDQILSRIRLILKQLKSSPKLKLSFDILYINNICYTKPILNSHLLQSILAISSLPTMLFPPPPSLPSCFLSFLFFLVIPLVTTAPLLSLTVDDHSKLCSLNPS